MSSYAHIDKKKKDILVFGKGPTRRFRTEQIVTYLLMG